MHVAKYFQLYANVRVGVKGSATGKTKEKGVGQPIHPPEKATAS